MNTDQVDEQSVDSNVDNDFYAAQQEEVVSEIESQETSETPVAEDKSTTPAAAREQTPKAIIDEESLARLAETLRPPQQAQQPQLTPEQIEELFRPVKLTKEHLKSLGFDEVTDEQVSGMKAMLEMAAQHAIATARVMQARELHALRQQLTPIQQAVQLQQAEQIKSTFFQKYPELTNYQNFVEVAARNVPEQSVKGKSPDEIMEVVAKLTKDILKQANPSLNFAAPAKPGVPASQVAKPAALEGGGRSTARASATANNPDADIYS